MSMETDSTSTGTDDLPGPARPGTRILFASAHSIIDPSSGAAVATLDASGFQCQAFCCTKFDFREEVCPEHIIGGQGESVQVRDLSSSAGRMPVLHVQRGAVPVTLVRTGSTLITNQRPE